ncbi:MAG: molecular chaperone [Caulobacter sp.]|nr:molecular chaperone [Caulobacter sp.]
MSRRLLAPLILLLASALAPPAAEASTLRVSPVSLDLPTGQNAAILTLFNDDAALLNVQVRVFRWRQVDGKDLLEPTTGVVASPPIAAIAAGAQRTVRVVRLDPKLPEKQEAYRLIVDELPPTVSQPGRQVTLLMRHSIPLFFAATPDKARVTWRLAPSGAVETLSVTNTGGRHLRVSNLRVISGSGQVLAERKGLVGYALPGSTMAWPLDAFPPSTGLHLTADTDIGPLDAPVAGD